MNKLIAIGEYMQNNGFGQLGSDLFVFHMPETVSTGILILDDNDNSTEIDEYIPNLRKSHFRMIVRSSDYQIGYGIAKDLRDRLNFYNVMIGDYRFLRLRPTYDPVAYPVPDSDIIEVSVNFWAAYIEP